MKGNIFTRLYINKSTDLTVKSSNHVKIKELQTRNLKSVCRIQNDFHDLKNPRILLTPFSKENLFYLHSSFLRFRTSKIHSVSLGSLSFVLRHTGFLTVFTIFIQNHLCHLLAELIVLSISHKRTSCLIFTIVLLSLLLLNHTENSPPFHPKTSCTLLSQYPILFIINFSLCSVLLHNISIFPQGSLILIPSIFFQRNCLPSIHCPFSLFGTPGLHRKFNTFSLGNFLYPCIQYYLLIIDLSLLSVRKTNIYMYIYMFIQL